MADGSVIARKSVEDIVALKDLLEKRDGERNNSYDEVIQFYGGDTLRNIRRKGFVAGIKQAISSIFQPKSEDVDAVLTTPINLVKPAIENKVAFLALQPTVRVIEPPDQYAPASQPLADVGSTQAGLGGGEMPAAPAALGGTPTPNTPTAPSEIPQDDWGTDFADRLEKVIITLLAQSNMPQRCRDVAWSMCAMDGAVIGVWPDMRHKRPRIFTRTPQDFYPVSYDPDGLELQLALWTETVSGSEVVARFGDEWKNKYGDKDDVDIIQCIDEGWYYTVLDETDFAHDPMENKMGIVPIVCVGSLGLPGMIFGSTDVKDAIPVAQQINYHMHLVDEMASAMVRPTIAVKDPLNVPDNIAIGRGGVITMGASGDVTLLGPLNLPNAFWQMGSQLQQWFDEISDNPQVLRSEDAGGLTTGRGFNAKLGPIAARMQTRLEILMSAWRQAMKYMLIMWATFPGMESVKSSGMKGKETYFIEATPEDFTVNGEMWTGIEVFLSAQSYMDRQGNAVEIMQLYQNELIDWDTAVDNLNQVTDKRRTRKRIDKDRQWKAQGMAIANQAAQSAMTANPNMADQQLTNYGLERGLVGETQPMPQPIAGGAGPQAEQPPLENEGPAEDIVEVLREFFASIGKLRGRVWFGGDPILAPDRLAGDNWKVDVWVTDPQDQGTITRAAENVEIIYGHLRFHRGQPEPEEQAIEVTSGPPVEEEPEEGPPMGEMPGGEPPGAMPPEIAAMMGGL